jgi:hypothetical protein
MLIKLRKIIWGEHVARVDEMRNATFQLENLQKRDHWGNQGMDGRIILEFVLKEYGVRIWTGFIWLRMSSSRFL